MNKQLTKEVAERCASFFGWEFVKKKESWYGGELHVYKTLPLGSDFWRPRLEDRLLELAKKKHVTKIYTQITLDYSKEKEHLTALFRIFADDLELGSSAEPLGEDSCLAYCDSIEKLTEEEEK